MSSLYDAFGALLSFFYGLIPNYGVAIILITVAIRLLLYPLTAKQARSMAKMQRVQPEIKKIQEKHKQDRQKLNEELMAFYKEHQINPLAGCLPLLLQFPIFIALFQVLRNPAKHIPDGSELFRAFCPGVDTAQACASTKGLPKGLSFLSMDLSRGANAAHASFLDALPFFILIALVVASGYFQSRQMAALQKGRATAQSQMMTRIFPVFFGVISYTLPAGVVLYFFVSNLWQIGQQAVVFGRESEPVTTEKKRGGKATPGATPEAPSDGGRGRRARPAPEALDAVVGGDAPAADPDGADQSLEGKEAGAKGGTTPAPARASATRPGDNRPNRAKARKKRKRKRRR